VKRFHTNKIVIKILQGMEVFLELATCRAFTILFPMQLVFLSTKNEFPQFFFFLTTKT